MRSADKLVLCTLALTCLLGTGATLAQDKSTYGKVDTFEPGKKYSCLPTADRKGWDCTQNGKAVDAPPAPPPAAPAPAPSHPVQPAPAPITQSAPVASEPTQSSAPSAVHSSELPGYLNARAASGGPAPQQPAAAPPQPVQKGAISTNPSVSRDSSADRTVAQPAHEPAAPKPSAPAPQSEAPREQVTTAPPPATPAAGAARTQPSTTPPAQTAAEPSPAAAARAPEHAPAPATQPDVEPAAPVAARAPEAPPPAATAPRTPARTSGAVALRSGDAFLALPADQYVIEVAHAPDAATLDAVDVHPTHGEVYKLHLLQNGVDNWLLVWGSFDDVSAARAARAELAADASVTPGWPRRIAPLQAEVRRTRD